MLSTISVGTSVSALRDRPARRTPRPAALSTRLRPADLLRITDEAADAVLAGRYEHLLPEGGLWPTENRWSTRLHSDDEVDVWLISWVPDKSTELHDHAGSLGALTVLSGVVVRIPLDG